MNLLARIRAQHGSIAQLKSSFSAAAMGMFTSGWVWFVTDSIGNTAIIPTFGPGSLLIRTRKYMAVNETATNEMLIYNQSIPRAPLGEEDPFHEEYQRERSEEYQRLTAEHPELAEELNMEDPDYLENAHLQADVVALLDKDNSLVDVLGDPAGLAERVRENPELAKVMSTLFAKFIRDSVDP